MNRIYITKNDNNCEFSGVVAQPFGQHTLLVPSTENVAYPLVWHTPPALSAIFALCPGAIVLQPTSVKTVVEPLAVISVGADVTGVWHCRACSMTPVANGRKEGDKAVMGGLLLKIVELSEMGTLG